jgi:Calcium binding
VKPGTSDPDFKDIPLGGWSGTITAVDETTRRPTYLIEWDKRTLDQMHPVYLKRCERDDLELESMWLEDGDIELDTGEPVAIQQPTQIITRPLAKHDQDDRIRAIFELTSDDPLPFITEENLSRYHRHLATHLSFPFQAEYRVETGPFEDTEYLVSVVGLLDPDESDEEEGLRCETVEQGQSVELPLAEIEATINLHNQQLIEDYSYWFMNGQGDSSTRTLGEIVRTKQTPARPLTFLSAVITISAVAGFYGATLGATLASFDGAFVAVKTGAVLLGFIGCFLGAAFGRLVGTMSRFGHGPWIGGSIGLLLGAIVGGLLGAMLVAIIGAVLGALGGGSVVSILRHKLGIPLTPMLGVIAGAMLGIAIQSWRLNPEDAWTGTWQGSVVAIIVGATLFFALGLAFTIQNKRRA